MFSRALHYLPATLLVALAACGGKPAPSRFTVPARFSVEEAAPASLTGSLIAMTFDSLGRPVVSKERGHPTVLIDSNGDGVYDAEKTFTDQMRNCQGLWFDARALYGSCNDAQGQAGLYRAEDTDGDDAADTFTRINVFERTMGEHGPHDIQRGPDGEITVMLGNHTAVPAELIEPGSPLAGYKESQLLERYMDARGHAAGIMAPGGYVARLNRETGRYTLLFGCFRNAYSHAYNLEGEAFTFDSDMEWDINMPWYREVRTVHAVPGGDYGWRTGSGKFPDYYIDTLPPVREVGRGSPVGVEFYHHSVYPAEYAGALLEGDWSRGRILISTPVRIGATYRIEGGAREFVHGEPLNVTDLEVGPDGFVYFTMGGRDTTGGFYRVRYTPSWFESVFRGRKPSGVLSVVRQPQPLSSWGHAALLRAKETMGASWASDLTRLARDASARPADRVQAILILQRLGPPLSGEIVAALAADRDQNVRAAAVYVAGVSPIEAARTVAARALHSADPLVRRRAAEALVRQNPAAEELAPLSGDLYALLDDPDRFVRYAARLALERAPRAAWESRALEENRPRPAMEALLALVRTARSDAGLQPALDRAIAFLRRSDLSTDDRLRLLRVLHLAILGFEKPVPAGARRVIHDLTAPQFPANDERLNRELARTLAWTGEPEAIAKILGAMPQADDNQPLQIHYVYCLRTIRRGWTPEQKDELLHWFAKAVQWRGGASFSGFINLMFDSSMEFFDAAEKKRAWARIPEFAPFEKPPESRPDRPGYRPTPVLARKKWASILSPQEIFEYQMYDPMTLRANPDEGRKIYEAECASCHRFGDIGKDFGPDLTAIQSRFQRKDLLEAVLWPSRTISDQYQGWIVETTDGDIINGLLVAEDNRRIVLRTAEVERPVEMLKSKVKSKRLSTVSLMPDKLLDGYGINDISNLFAFLTAKPGK
jgi:putative heme-binding domain-containing protein